MDQELKAYLDSRFSAVEDRMEAGFRDVRGEMEVGFKQARAELEATETRLLSEFWK